MRPRIVEFLNQLFDTKIFEWLIPYPAMVYALTMLICMVVFIRRCNADKLSRYHALGATIWAMVGGLIGARMFFLLMHIDRVFASPQIIFSISGGTASWGAYLGGTASFIAYFVYHHQPGTPYFDVLGSLIGLGPFMGRWSCFLNGDDFGTLSDAPWAVVYPHASIPFIYHVKQGLIDPLTDFSLSIHPVQLYLALNGLILFIFFTLLWKKKQYAFGSLFWLFWATYSFSRFFLEYFRSGIPRDILGIFSLSQVMAIIVFITSISCLIFLAKSKKFTKYHESTSAIPIK